MAALAESESSYEEEYPYSNSFKAPTSMKSRDGSLNEHSSGSPLGDCGRMICGTKKSQDKFMRRTVRDPNR